MIKSFYVCDERKSDDIVIFYNGIDQYSNIVLFAQLNPLFSFCDLWSTAMTRGCYLWSSYFSVNTLESVKQVCSDCLHRQKHIDKLKMKIFYLYIVFEVTKYIDIFDVILYLIFCFLFNHILSYLAYLNVDLIFHIFLIQFD